MAVDRASIAGVVLAGGRSRRMGGGDKGLVMLAGTPMLGHVIARLRPQVSALAINANGDPARFSAFELPVIADVIGGQAGPLAGIHAAMRWARRNVSGATWIATASSDVPFLPDDLVSRLEAAVVAAGGDRIAIAYSGGRAHPVIGLWPLALADALETAVSAGEFRVGYWAKAQGAIDVEFPMLEHAGRAIDAFFNANTPDDIEEARRILAGEAGPPSAARPALGIAGPSILGIVGWKNSGKTTLVVHLLADLSRRGHRISTIKHAHHDIELDAAGTDSARHRGAGAGQVAVVSPQRWGIMRELGRDPEPALAEIVARLDPCDLILVEGYKHAAIPKIEVRRHDATPQEALADGDSSIIAIVTDAPMANARVPTFAPDQIGEIADFIETSLALAAASPAVDGSP